MEGILEALARLPLIGPVADRVADHWIRRGGDAVVRMPRRAVRRVVADLEPEDYVTVYLVPRRGRDRYVVFRVTEESECVVRGGAVRARRVSDFEGTEVSSHAIPVGEIERVAVHHQPTSDSHAFYLAAG